MTRLGSDDPRQLGPYRLHGVLGGGGMGRVYLGRGAPHRGGRKQTVAVRALRPELLRDRQLRARLRHETQVAAAGVDSPFVAGALGCELDSERPWVADEFVPGPSLATLVRRYGPLPEDAVRALGSALCRALLALHGARIAHRDLRAAHVLLAADHPRVVGCGLGLKHSDPTGEGEAAGPADDVFELGVLLVYAACAHPPFTGSLLASGRESPDLSGVPPGLRPALLACLHKTSEARPLPGPLARALDLEDRAERPAAEWLPEHCLHDIHAVADAARRLTGRRLFGR